MNVNNLVINRALRFMLLDRATGHLLVNVLEVSEPSLEISGEQVFATDATGKRIAAFDRSKDATLSASSSLFDLNLLAAQSGTEKVVASDSAKIVTPVVDILVAESNDADGFKITLSETPKNPITEIALLNDDGSTKEFFEADASASATAFSIAEKVITLPTAASVKAGTRWLVIYEAETANGVSIVNSADNSTKGGKGILEVLFCDPCNQDVEYYGYLIFPNGKFAIEQTIDINTESTQAFSFEAMQDWCSTDKKLFELVVVDKAA